MALGENGFSSNSSIQTLSAANYEHRIRILWLTSFRQPVPGFDWVPDPEGIDNPLHYQLIKKFYGESLHRPQLIFHSRGLQTDYESFQKFIWAKFLVELRQRADAIDIVKTTLELMYLGADIQDESDVRNILLDSLFDTLTGWLYFKPELWPVKTDAFGVPSPDMSEWDLIQRLIVMDQFRAYSNEDLWAAMTDRHPIFPFILKGSHWKVVWNLFWEKAPRPMVRQALGKIIQESLSRLRVSEVIRDILEKKDTTHLAFFRPSFQYMLNRDYPLSQPGSDHLHQKALEIFQSYSGDLASEEKARLGYALFCLGVVVTVISFGAGSPLLAGAGLTIGVAQDVVSILEYHNKKDEKAYLDSLGINPYVKECMELAKNPEALDKFGYALSVFSLLGVLKKATSAAVILSAKRARPRFPVQEPPSKGVPVTPEPIQNRGTHPDQRQTSPSNRGTDTEDGVAKRPIADLPKDLPDTGVTAQIEKFWMAEELTVRTSMMEHQLSEAQKRVKNWKAQLKSLESEIGDHLEKAQTARTRASNLRAGKVEARWHQSTRDRAAVVEDQMAQAFSSEAKVLQRRAAILLGDIERAEAGIEKLADVIRWNAIALQHILGTRHPNWGIVVETYLVPRIQNGRYALVRVNMPAIDGVEPAEWGHYISKVVQSKISISVPNLIEEASNAGHAAPHPYQLAEIAVHNALEDARGKLIHWEKAAEQMAEDKVFGLLPPTHAELKEFRLLIVIPTSPDKYFDYNMIKYYAERMVDPRGELRNLVIQVELMPEAEILRLTNSH
ncbi:MAG: hypothetical protein AB7F86_16850 [Bdellovibrionales bacterium]